MSTARKVERLTPLEPELAAIIVALAKAAAQRDHVQQITRPAEAAPRS